ncbi:MAG TPA: alpha/beta fold hydrolase [Planctomycetota bacterium]|nr:alpha/beta fold hydrolase [Planctomycetota bacterium]
MRLAFQDLSSSDAESLPVVVLHGLLGSSRNWQSAARDLAQARRVIVPDLRNHGESPWSDRMDFDALVDDVRELLDDLSIGRAAILGHSMGGKAAMRFACRHPDRVSALITVDIAPRAYEAGSKELDAMARLDLAQIESRRDAEERLAERIPDRATRQFLLTSLTRDQAAGGWRWKPNVHALHASLADLRRSPLDPDDRFMGPTLVVAGGASVFVAPEDHATIRAHFPAAEIAVLEGVGHNVHVEAREAFVSLVQDFLGERPQ